MRGPAWAAVAGAAVLVVHAALLAARPVGCVGGDCYGGRAFRPSEDLAWLFLVGVLLLVVAAARSPLLPRGGRVAAALAMATGAALLTVGLGVNVAFPDENPVWWLVDSDTLGRVLPLTATGIAGIAILRRRSDARWVGYLLVAAVLCGLPFNIQDWRVLLNLPMAAGWALLGGRAIASARS